VRWNRLIQAVSTHFSDQKKNSPFTRCKGLKQCCLGFRTHHREEKPCRVCEPSNSQEGKFCSNKPLFREALLPLFSKGNSNKHAQNQSIKHTRSIQQISILIFSQKKQKKSQKNKKSQQQKSVPSVRSPIGSPIIKKHYCPLQRLFYENP
jgi:hypothetical protein